MPASNVEPARVSLMSSTAPSGASTSAELTPAVRVALRVFALVVLEEDPERRRAIGEAGRRKIEAAIKREKRQAEARAALETAVGQLGGERP